MKTKNIICAITVFLSCSVSAAPVYLDCQIETEKDGIKKFSTKLDEQTNKVTHTYADGAAFNTEGFFSAETVTYKRVQFSGGLEITTQYEINRENLSLKYIFKIEPQDKQFLSTVPPDVTRSSGSCKIVEQKKKAF